MSELKELDIRIFKTLMVSKLDAVNFAFSYSPDLFHEKRFANLFVNYIKAFNCAPTLRTLQEYTVKNLNRKNENEYIETIWKQIENYNYNINEYNFDLEQIKNRYIDETLKDIKRTIETTNDPESITKSVALKLQTIRTIKEGRSFTQKTVKNYVDEFEDKYRAIEQNPEGDTRILTHYSALDYAFGGYRPAELFIVGGESGGGKSIWLINKAIQMWMQNNTINMGPNDFEKGHNVIYFSLEMPYEDCYTRFLARMAQVPERHLIDATLTSEEREKVEKAKKFIKEYPYEFDIVDSPRGVTIGDIEMRYNDALLQYKPEICIVDYMGLMKSPMHENKADWLKMGEIGGELHEFGRIYNIVMGSAVQLTDIQRGSKTDPKDKTEGQRVGMHRVGRSSQIMHHANFGLQIETRANEERFGDFKYHLIKSRRGPKVKGTLRKLLSHCSLFDTPYEPETLEHSNNDIDDTLTNAQAKLSAAIEASNE